MTKLKIIHFNAMAVINKCDGWASFSRVSFRSIEYVVVKTLIEKNSPLPKSKCPFAEFW